ncbi:uncharacterized protein ACJ7VT_005967 [Polymixia lowei]
MSQLRGPTTDTQALLQSMLQRLKLQPGTESQGCLLQSNPTTAVPNQGANGKRGALHIKTAGSLNNVPVNGFGAAVTAAPRTGDIIREPNEEGRGGRELRKWDSREFGIPVWNSQQPAHTPKLDRGQEVMAFSSSAGSSVTSSPSHEDNTVSDRVENRGLGQAMLPEVTPTAYGQLFPVKAQKEADVTSIERREDKIQGEREGTGNPAMKNDTHSKNFVMQDAVTKDREDRGSSPDNSPLTSQSPNQNSRTTPEVTAESRTLGHSQDHDSTSAAVQGFTPRVYMWSLKTTEASVGAGSKDTNMLHVSNGGSGVLAQSKSVEIFSASQKTANSTSGSKAKKQLPERTRRWTKKIKERWRERHGSLEKKGKEEDGREEMKNEPPAAENLISTSNREGERTSHLLIRSDHANTLPTPSGDCTEENHIRSTNDFEFGLGSFNLLDEILTGQEWARYLNPMLSGISTNQRPAEQPTSQIETTPNPQDQDRDQSSVILSQLGGANNQWNSRGTESVQVSEFTMTPISDVSVNMDISEPNDFPEQDVIDRSFCSLDMKSKEKTMGLENAAQVDLKSAEVLDNLALKSRVNRKREHQSREKRERGRAEEDKEDKKDESTSSPGTATSPAVNEEEELQDDNVMLSLYPSKSSMSPVISSSPTTPIAVPRSVLRHTVSQDSESSISMETVTKRRRVDNARRVHFSEEVITIAPINLDLDDMDSEEEDSAEDSTIEEEVGMEQQEAVKEVVVPAPRPALPAWIQALKRRKTGRKVR